MPAVARTGFWRWRSARTVRLPALADEWQIQLSRSASPATPASRCLIGGASEQEVRDAVLEGPRGDAEGGRRDSRRNFELNAEWNGRRYAMKQVRPVFVEEAGEVVVVTVYVYYF